MFELSIALKYLVPRRKQLSVSLIALMSAIVISLVVWLVLVFLSVTEGIEKNWLNKLTALNAPLRITPTEEYYSSYYYLVDGYSTASHFSSKNIAQKASSHRSDPYVLEDDCELPKGFPLPDLSPQGSLKDPVKEVYRILKEQKNQHVLAYQDYEISGALMRLQLLRENKSSMHPKDAQSFLTQVSYLASIPDQSPAFASMLLQPSEKDLNHLFYLSTHTTEFAREDSPSLTLSAPFETVNKRLSELLSASHIQELHSDPYWKLSSDLLVENIRFQARAIYRGNEFLRLALPKENAENDSSHRGILWRTGESLYFQEKGKEAVLLPHALPLYVEGAMRFAVQDIFFSKDVQRIQDVRFKIHTELQNIPLSGYVSWDHLSISKAAFQTEKPCPSPWPTFHQNQIHLPVNAEKETGVLLAKNYRDTGVMIGDRGYLSYNSTTASSIQEQRLPIFVAGFYDPGILSVGNRCILTPPFVTQTINASSSTFNLDKTQSNGILVWFDPVSNAEHIKQEILTQFERAGIASYWKVTTYKEYDFAKDLLQQFQSDKYLFSLVAGIIILVACCNIISLLTLLVNDKKREIGILQAMGASRRSIAWIFGACGVGLGVISCLFGTGLAIFTLKHIDAIVRFLSLLQGRDAFNAAFFGSSLHSALSTNALTFIFIITPLLSLLAGLVPAVKACRLRPSEILRSE